MKARRDWNRYISTVLDPENSPPHQSPSEVRILYGGLEGASLAPNQASRQAETHEITIVPRCSVRIPFSGFPLLSKRWFGIGVQFGTS